MAAATANGDFPKSIIFRPEGVDWWDTFTHEQHPHPHTEVRAGFWLHATHRTEPPLPSHPRNSRFGLFWLLQMNILARTLMDGWTDGSESGRATGRCCSGWCRNSHFKAHTMHSARPTDGGEIPLIQKCRQLIINAAGLPIYRNNPRGCIRASCSSLK